MFKDHVRVFDCPTDTPKINVEGSGSLLAHWTNANGSMFKNPWPSYQAPNAMHIVSMLKDYFFSYPSIPKDIAARVPVVKPTWGADSSNNKIKATWLGHACFMVELPVRPATAGAGSSSPSRGARILFDPVFSERCAPIGFSRFTKMPCAIDEIPEVDAVVISHNHYDHLDTHTITTLSKRERPPHFFAPLGNVKYFSSIGIPNERVHTLDWWKSQRVEVNTSISDKDIQSTKLTFDVTCTPAQHRTGRGLRDQNKTLWASWVVQEVLPTPAAPTGGKDGVKVYFAGDTGYSATIASRSGEGLPTCPAFREIGERWGSFDFAMIPIGAYKPRDVMSCVHCAPQDSVRIFRDIRAKKALGMHWGTWILTTEDVLEPPIKLAEECKKIGIPEGDFGVCNIGETVVF
ncbi:hypothetical protein EW145_g211 [Phellinidium pouzarii]|uniref:Metallo-beta-lactamase domain-containing protein n=1 Tax=Phellinidium pouzarii TaxID=167371 RepID=A0A4V3XE37_9AGAM|nr:hypothetical protein EW145_g211 [Phellinidium pouzarii]